MITVTAIFGVALAALGIVPTPGPNMMYLVSRTVSQACRAGLVSLCGVAAGFLVYLTAAAAGLTTIFAVVPELYSALKLAGTLYLGWLAWKTLRPGGTSAFAPTEFSKRLRPHGGSWRSCVMSWTELTIGAVALNPCGTDYSEHVVAELEVGAGLQR